MKKRAPGYQKERGERQEKRILEALASRPMTAYELAEKLFLSRHCVQVHVKRLMKRPNRRVHIASYEVGGGGRPKHVYALGAGNNVTISAYQQGRILDILSETAIPKSAYQIAELIGMGYGIVKIYVRGLRKAHRIHVATWLWSNKTPMPMYLAGRDEDAPKPTKRDLAPHRVVTAPQGIFAMLGI
jgi:hypothetical protein